MISARLKQYFLIIAAMFFLSAGCKRLSKKFADLTAPPAALVATKPTAIPNSAPLKNMFGINAYEWNFLGPADPSKINEGRMAVIKSFTAVRHYLDWEKLEPAEGKYTFNPVHNGGWNYDTIYKRCKQDSMLLLADIKTTPPWLVSTYPQKDQNGEVAPLAFGAKKDDPASYIKQARVAFQYAARYGSNKAVNKALVTVDTTQRWKNDPRNVVKTGMGLINYVECNNEPDRWWKGPLCTQSAEEYAANLSAFYDGDQGRLGNNAGIKTADPNMQVVMGGICTNDAGYVRKMITWCKKHRGYKPDGSINVCFDVINFHYYASSGKTPVPPEFSDAGQVADSFLKVAGSLPSRPRVWITETGYDINQQSLERRAIAIGNKPAVVTQADWLLRTALLFMRHGISRLFYYQLYDDTPGSGGTYATSGLAEDTKRRPAADYMVQVNRLMGDYLYKRTINTDPLVDVYQKGNKVIYVLTIPDQVGRTGKYSLQISGTATIYSLKAGADAMTATPVRSENGKLTIPVSETPVFVAVDLP